MCALSCLLSRIFEVNGNRGTVRFRGSGITVPWWLLLGDSPEPSRTQLFRLDAHWGKLEMFPQSYLVPLSPVLQVTGR